MGRPGAVAAVLVAAACLWPGAHPRADEWPSRPVKIVVAFAPGGSADQFGRLMAAELSAAFKQQFFVENRPGNSGAIGSAQVARAEPDGYTLLIGGSGPHLTGPAINPNIGYEPLKDFTHIAMIGADSYAWAVNPALGVKSIAELVTLAKNRKDADHVVVARPGLARASADRAVQAQGRHRHPARAGAELGRDRRAGQPHLDDAHRHDDGRRAGQGRQALGAGGDLDRAQSGVQGHSDLRRAGLSGRARRHLVLAVRTEEPAGRGGRQAQPAKPGGS